MEVIQLMACGMEGLYAVDDRLPWHLPEELANFKAITTAPDSAVVVSMATLLTIPNRLKGRRIYVLSRTPNKYIKDIQELATSEAGEILGVNTTPEFTMDVARSEGIQKLYVIGGGPIWEKFEPHYTKRYISYVKGSRIDPVLKGTRAMYPVRPDRNNKVVRVDEREGYVFTEYKVRRNK